LAKWDLSVIEQAFAGAAVDGSSWNGALEIAVEQTGSYGAILLNTNGKLLPGSPMTERMKPSAECYFRDEWYLRDERFRGISIMMRNGVCDDLEIMDSDVIKRHPYYQEFLAPFGLRSFAGVRMATDRDTWCLSLQRGITDDLYSRDEKRKLAKLSESLSSAATVAQALGFAATDAAMEAFEVSGTGILLLNWRGEIARVNRAAERMLGHGVRIAGRRLVTTDTAATDQLDRALHRLLWLPSQAALSPPMALTRQDRLPLLAYPLKLASLTVNPFAEAKALVVLVDPTTRPRPPEATLRDVFGLTAAEARLAARLAAGEALEAIADDLNITKETARFHLKHVFAKTGVRRQAELVAVFARLLSRPETP